MDTSWNLTRIERVWESLSLNPAVIVIRTFDGKFKLIVLHVEIYTDQTRPAVYDIDSDESGYYIGCLALGGQRITYEPISDTLNLSRYGDYMRCD